MATFLFDEIIFGPIQSRRLGTSLGINLLPEKSKFCNFNCIYCECGWTPGQGQMQADFHSVDKVIDQLEAFLKQYHAQGKNIDTITFAGNGEPTLHPHFKEIIEKTVQLRDQYYPASKVSVLSNATMLHNSNVVEGLLKADNRILKLDTVLPDMAQWINQPLGKYSIDQLKEQLQVFKGAFIIQTMFLKAFYQGQQIDNTQDQYLTLYKQFLSDIRPQKIMIYTVDRDTPLKEIFKISKEGMLAIKDFLSDLQIPIEVAG